MDSTKKLLSSYISRIRWYAASPEPNWISITLSTPTCFIYSSLLLFMCFLQEDSQNFRLRGSLKRPQFHGEARRSRIFWPVELCSMKSGSWLNQEDSLLVRLLELDEIGLIVDIIDLVDSHPHELLQLLQHADNIQGWEPGLHPDLPWSLKWWWYW